MDLSNIKQARLIKLGEKGRWEERCINDGTIRLGYHEVPYALAAQKDALAIKNLFIKRGLDKGKATDHARQVLDFYHCGPETLWITFSDGYLRWCVSDSPTEYIGAGPDHPAAPDGTHLRRSLHGWRNTSLNGTPLNMRDLSGCLTSVIGYRGTICDVSALDYLMRKLQDQDLPQIAKAKKARDEMREAVKELIQLLTPQDFELFVDLIFSHSGWRRISSVGGPQKTQDLELILPSTGEIAVIQVKSRTNQAELNDYIERFSAMSADKYFYAYHTAAALDVSNSKVILLDLNKLAALALQAGLTEWLINKCG